MTRDWWEEVPSTTAETARLKGTRGAYSYARRTRELQFCHFDSAVLPGFFSCLFPGAAHPVSAIMQLGRMNGIFDDVLHRVHKQRPSLPTRSLHLFYERLFSFKVVNISLVRSQVVEIIISGCGRSTKPPDVPVTLAPSLFCTLTSNHSLRNGDSICRIYSKQPIGLKRKDWAK